MKTKICYSKAQNHVYFCFVTPFICFSKLPIAFAVTKLNSQKKNNLYSIN
jgi:hypothetical protein